MKLWSFVFVVVLAYCSRLIAGCPPNEHYEAYGSECSPSCSDPRPRGKCTLRRGSGCFCDQGYVRSPQGNCIDPKFSNFDFPAPTKGVCLAGEIPQDCGPRCEPVCGDLRGQLCFNDPQLCRVGCFCAPGLVRLSGRCVEPRRCPAPPKCRPGEIYNACGPSCPANCTNLWPSGPCLFDCVSGCYCPSGLVRSPSGDCIEPRWCPNFPIGPAPPLCKCPPNEVYDVCGAVCPATCSNPSPSGKCTQECGDPSCVCVEGYVRAPNGICINPQWCPVCPSDEHYDAFGPACPPSCFDLQPSGECNRRYIAGCVCDAGLVRSPFGICVKPSWCPDFNPTTLSAPIRLDFTTTTVSAPIDFNPTTLSAPIRLDFTTTTVSAPIAPSCAGLENGIHGDLCSPNFFLCYKGQLSLGDCPSNLYFSGGNGQGACVSLSKCALG